LAVVDPPYGIGKTWLKNRKGQKEFNCDYKNNKIPDDNYFNGLYRISKNWIIWGANFFHLVWPCKNIIVWDKVCKVEKDFKSEIEIATTSITKYPSRKYTHQWAGGRKEKETGIKIIHPHQKPIALYKWILANYAKPGQTIFDSHVGSGSSRIACYDMGFDFIGCELDESYYVAQEKRFQDHIKQAELFTTEERQEMIYKENTLFDTGEKK
jgi:site-specific DNA-methyltransferase (adenine-specific)